MGTDVNKVGQRTGWTTGEITGTGATLQVNVYHPDGVKRSTRLKNYIKASTPVNTGDSGAALFTIVSDPDPSDVGGFLGIQSACDVCNPLITSETGNGFYVPWASIDLAMNQNISLQEDQGGE
jgi:hypothetical protein